MKAKTLLLIVSFVLGITLMSCEKEAMDNTGQGELVTKAKGGNGKGGKPKDPPPPPTAPEEEVFETYFMLSQVIDPDPLYRFSISQSGNAMMLETDPTITSWGRDYWGYWDEDFPFANNKVDYTFGLGNTVYTFTQVSPGVYDVTKKLVVSSYNSNTVTTTYSHPGIYTVVP